MFSLFNTIQITIKDNNKCLLVIEESNKDALMLQHEAQ
jgi:hypothetical protein